MLKQAFEKGGNRMKKLLRVSLLWIASLPLIAREALAQVPTQLPSWFSGWYDAVIPPFQGFVVKTLGFLPELVGILAIVFAGAFVAKWVRIGVRTLLDLDTISRVTTKLTKKPLQRANISTSFGDLVGDVAYYVLILITLVIAVDYYGRAGSSYSLASVILGYLPNVIGAGFVAIVGIVLAAFVAGLVQIAAANLKIDEAEGLGKLTRLAIVIFTAVAVLDRLGISLLLTGKNAQVLFTAVALALALAFGLGGKDIAGKYLSDVIRKYKKD